MSDKPDLLNIIEAAMNTCHAEGDYDPENDYIKDPLCRRVYHALGQSAAEIARLREAVRVLGAVVSDVIQEDLSWSAAEERKSFSDLIPESVRNNPIAAAAVRGEVKHGN
jgi:hypothetical protein